MFSRPLLNADPCRASSIPNPAVPQYRLGDFGYGKLNVRVFQLQKDGPYHSVTEYSVSSQMRLKNHKEYYQADNSEIIGSDVVETQIYMHAQKYGLKTPEEFALSLSKHLLDTYELIAEANVLVDELTWARLGEHEHQGYYRNKPHNHVFLRETNGRRYCEVVRKRDAPPLLMAGISNLRIVKTACAPFTGYVKGSLYTEGDMPDRILCVDINAKWQYAHVEGVDFASHWYRVRDIVLQNFAGDTVKGIITTSVQYISYATEKAILEAMAEIVSVSINVPNYPHLPFDFSRFPPLEKKANVIISCPKEAPKSIGYARLDREKTNGNDGVKVLSAL